MADRDWVFVDDGVGLEVVLADDTDVTVRSEDQNDEESKGAVAQGKEPQ